MAPAKQSRREFLAIGATLGVFAAAPTLWWQYGKPLTGAKLAARPKKPTKSVAAGTHPLELGIGERDGFLYVPRSYDPKKPAPLIVGLHGATQAARFIT